MSKADIKTRKTVNLKYPDRFKIVILNDDYTPLILLYNFLLNFLTKILTKQKRLHRKSTKQDKALVVIITSEI